MGLPEQTRVENSDIDFVSHLCKALISKSFQYQEQTESNSSFHYNQMYTLQENNGIEEQNLDQSTDNKTILSAYR